MEHRAAERLAQRFGTGERPEERNLRFVDQRQRGQAGRRADVAEQGEHVVLDELVGVRLAALGLVSVVGGAQLDRHAVDAARGIDHVEVDPAALVHLDAQLRGRAAEGSRLPEHERLGLGPGGQGDGSAGGGDPLEGVTTFHRNLHG